MARVCSGLWDPHSELYTDPLMPKGLSADTSAAYGLMAFIGDNPRLKLVLSGRFPRAKFMSLQAYRGRLQRQDYVGDALLDYEIIPSSGDNPFAMHDPTLSGEFRIEITPDENADGLPNTIWYRPVHFDPLEDRSIISAFYRVYQPEREFTLDDLPRIEARDVHTNALLPCPEDEQLFWYLDLPNALANLIVHESRQVTFKTKRSSAGTNDAIPAYLYSASKIPKGNVVVVKFTAPAINFAAPNEPDVRYWSLCTMNWSKLMTLNGVACDWSHPHRRSITVVFGHDPDEDGDSRVRDKALTMGYFLPDTRDPNQRVLGFIYRNILPTDDFKRNHMYQSEFRPTGTVYSTDEFLALP